MKQGKFKAFVGIAAAACAIFTATQARAATTMYICAHQDDWLLFMGGNAWYDLYGGIDTVFIYVTAGDGGEDTGGDGLIPFYRAREEAAIASIQTPAFLSGSLSVADGWHSENFNGHTINYYRFKNTTHYFMRLPDGNPGGGGYPVHGNQSLGRCNNGNIPRIDAIDGSASYLNWNDLTLTLRAIIMKHKVAAGVDQFWIDTQDPDHGLNVGDHSDHLHTGKLAWDAGRPVGAKFSFWLDYVINTKPVNLGREDFLHKATMHGALAGTLAKYGYHPTFDEFHTSFLDRSYNRLVP